MQEIQKDDTTGTHLDGRDGTVHGFLHGNDSEVHPTKNDGGANIGTKMVVLSFVNCEFAGAGR